MGAQLPGLLAEGLEAHDFDAKGYQRSIERRCGQVSCSAGLGGVHALKGLEGFSNVEPWGI